MNGGDGGKTMRMYLIPQNYKLKMVKMSNFMLFYHNKKGIKQTFKRTFSNWF